MTGMPMQRPNQRRSSLLPLACGCLASFAILGAILVIGGIIFLPEIGARLAGFTPQGQTESIFTQPTIAPTVELQNPTPLPQISVDLGQYGVQTFNNDNPQLYDFTVGTGANGAPTMMATFTENGLMTLCRQRLTLCAATSSDPRFSNARIDLRPGGAVVYVDVTLPQFGGLTETAGIVLTWDAVNRRVVFAGVDIKGTLYTAPPEGLGVTAADIEKQANDLIQQLAFQTSSGRYTLSEVRIDDTTLTLVLR